MSLTDALKKTSLAELNLHNNTANRLVMQVFAKSKGESPHDSEFNQLRQTITVEQVIKSFGVYKFGYSPGSSERAFIRELALRGVTRLDWLCMPQTTVTRGLLLSLTREQLLRQPALVLGTVSKAMIDIIARETDWLDNSSDLTVQQMLRYKTGVFIEERLRTNCWKGVQNTRELLLDLGFDAADGPFMRLGTTLSVEESLRSKYPLTEAELEKIVTIAVSEGWIPKSFSF